MIKSLDFIATPERSRRTRFSFEEAPLAGMSMLSQREARMEAGRPCRGSWMEWTGAVQGASTDRICICRYLCAWTRGGGIQADPRAGGLSNWKNDASPHSYSIGVPQVGDPVVKVMHIFTHPISSALQSRHYCIPLLTAEGLETKRRAEAWVPTQAVWLQNSPS